MRLISRGNGIYGFKTVLVRTVAPEKIRLYGYTIPSCPLGDQRGTEIAARIISIAQDQGEWVGVSGLGFAFQVRRDTAESAKHCAKERSRFRRWLIQTLAFRILYQLNFLLLGLLDTFLKPWHQKLLQFDPRSFNSNPMPGEHLTSSDVDAVEFIYGGLDWLHGQGYIQVYDGGEDEGPIAVPTNKLLEFIVLKQE